MSLIGAREAKASADGALKTAEANVAELTRRLSKADGELASLTARLRRADEELVEARSHVSSLQQSGEHTGQV